MTGPLSDDARTVLAFIRDHPGQTFEVIDKQIPIGTERLWNAMKQLTERKYVEPRNRLYRYPENKGMPKSIVFYPV